MEKNKIKKAFSIFNGGEGLDHWSYSSTSTPFAKNLIGYTFPQEVRRTFAFRYKANFGNLVNNTVQKIIGDERRYRGGMSQRNRDNPRDEMI